MTVLHVVMPAYNEAEGIASFIEEIRTHVGGVCDEVRFFVVNDVSTDDTAAVLQAQADRFRDVHTVTAEANRGHGPSALAAYRLGLTATPDLVIHVDGDGQFLGRDFPRLIAAMTDADVVHGVRRGRSDPWYRRMLSRGTQVLVRAASGVSVPDINTPLRAYRPESLAALLRAVDRDLLVPHVHFSIAEARLGLRVGFVTVESQLRRGTSPAGTMWGTVKSPSLPPKRLRVFVRSALVEVWHHSLRPGAALRALRASR